MKVRRFLTTMLIATAVTALRASTPGTAAPIPFPDVELTRLDGVVIRSTGEIPAEGKWLVVYVQPNCRPCDALLRLVKEPQHPGLPPRMIVIVGGVGAAEAGRMRQMMVDLAGASWYADPARGMGSALQLTGAPMIFGVRDLTIDWSLSGGLPSPGDVTSILTGWVDVP